MIYLIIGGSCCGKTSFVKNTWLKGKSFETKKDILTYVETDNAIILGKYSNIDGRERSGTDTISRSQVSLIGEQVKSLVGYDKDIVLDGDKATSRKLFDFLLSLDKTQLILIHCDATLSLQRNYEQNTIVSEATLKRILSKAKNIFGEYKDKMNGICIDTSKFTIEDFKAFSLYNYKSYIKEDNNKLTLF